MYLTVTHLERLPDIGIVYGYDDTGHYRAATSKDVDLVEVALLAGPIRVLINMHQLIRPAETEAA